MSGTAGKPLVPIAPIPLEGRNLFQLCDAERQLFDCFAQELNKIAGTQVDYFSIDLNRSKRDALYDEPTQYVFRGPFRISGYVQWPEDIPEAREEGLRITWEAEAWIARKEFEDAGAPPPSEGDVLKFWSIPYFDKNAATGGENVPGSGFYFDVIDAEDDGHMFDTASFVGYKIKFKRRTEFTPERRLTPP